MLGQSVLNIAARCTELTGPGYIGVDLVLDKEKRPLILEMNARPGLNIQIANRAELLPRLQLVEENHRGLPNIEERIAFSIEHFNASSLFNFDWPILTFNSHFIFQFTTYNW
ncbi:MAG: sugar-transfer associated ATP-grasp domain-containing protein [Desulfobacterales bacterium]|jgi:hypothetical protein